MYCECGCGMVTALAKSTDPKRGYVKGKHKRFRQWHLKRAVRSTKYLAVSVPGHPRAWGNGKTVKVHMLIAESVLGYYPPKGVEVHHVDGNTRNNEKSNLVICQDHAYHMLLHHRARVLAAGGDPNTDHVCGMCKQVKRLETFSASRSNKSVGRKAQCLECARTKTNERRAANRTVGAVEGLREVME